MPHSPIAGSVPTPTPATIQAEASTIDVMRADANVIRAQLQRDTKMKNAFRRAILLFVTSCIVMTSAIFALKRMYSGIQVVVMLGLGAGLTLCFWAPYKLAASVFGMLCEDSEEVVHMD
ncbi:hypothetical protein LTR17_001234 [Elasticomyces elasticus]|nr:hypothetical protein LTR17_001234 [Elasticomyces elasticus]